MASKKTLIIISVLLGFSIVGNVCFTFSMVQKNKSEAIAFESYSNSVFQLSIENGQDYNFATCFSYNSDGVFVTNYHPIKAIANNVSDAKLTIVDLNSKSHNAMLLGIDVQRDIAVVSCKDFVANPVKLYEKLPALGEKCYSLGNANGLGVALYDGIISNPEIRLIVDGSEQSYIQAKNDVYPGCSGGCLLNKNGSCIGMISFRTKDKNGNPVTDFSYSIPTNIISTVVKGILK